MTFLFVFLSLLAAVNPPRLRLAFPETEGRGRVVPIAIGVALVFGLGAIAAAVANSFLDVLNVSTEMWRIATGLVLAVFGLTLIAFPRPGKEPELAGWRAALIPVTFPLLVTPQLFIAVIAFATVESAAKTLGALAIVLLLAGLLSQVTKRASDGLWIAAARFHSALLVIAGVSLVVEGLRDL